MKTLVILGHGYVGAALVPVMRARGWQVAGTTRGDPARVAASGAQPLIWASDAMRAALARADAVLACAAPENGGMKGGINGADPALPYMTGLRPGWAGYLSSTSVYGDAGGAWVDEDSPTAPASARGRARLAAEAAWQAWGPVHVFRLAGIYGPGRDPFTRLRAGTARRIIKPGQVFSRIHVDDIAGALAASIAAPCARGAVWNLADDLPAPPQDVIEAAARMAGLPVPPPEDFARAALTPAARAFYDDNRRVSNARIKAALGWRPVHPDYHAGLRALTICVPTENNHGGATKP